MVEAAACELVGGSGAGGERRRGGQCNLGERGRLKIAQWHPQQLLRDSLIGHEGDEVPGHASDLQGSGTQGRPAGVADSPAAAAAEFAPV